LRRGKTAAGCGSFTVTNNWIFNSNIQLLAGANNIVTCGSIDSKSFIQNAGTITVPGGATDHGSTNPFRQRSFGATDSSHLLSTVRPARAR
jgi:hypothetical protein